MAPDGYDATPRAAADTSVEKRPGARPPRARRRGGASATARRTATRSPTAHRGRATGGAVMADRRLRAAIDALADQLYILDLDTMRFVDANRTAEVLSGFTLAELQQHGPERLLEVSAGDAREFCDHIEQAGAAGVRNEALGVNRAGHHASVEALHAAFGFAGGRYVVSAVRDVRARKAEEASHRRLRDMYLALCSTNEAILRATSPEDLYARVCAAATEGGFLGAAVYIARDDDERARLAASSGPVRGLLDSMDVGFGAHRTHPHQIIARTFRERTPNYFTERDYDRLGLLEGQLLRGLGVRAAAALPIRRDDGCVGVLCIAAREADAFEADVRGLLVRMCDNIAFGVANLEALAERERAERRAAYLATHDAMTGLPNRALFSELLTQALHSARRQQSRLAVLFIDLDRFKVINDSLGHDAGDALLRTMAQRLRQTLRASDVVARLGGDEFVVLLPDIARRAEAATVARKLLHAIEEPLTLEGHECRCSASVGIALFPEGAHDEQTLMSNADAAMYRAKKGGRSSVQFFARGDRHATTHQLTLESQLRGALARQEFALVYQPKLELASGVITGVEALLRWHNPQLGAVTPAEFIPIAEETGLIEEIGRWVLRTACAQNVAWQAAGCRHVAVAVNLSANQFLGRSLVRDVDEALALTGMDARLLELEITESMVVQNPIRAREILAAIKARGVRIAIDDFGTGYSSLGQLRNFPIDTLKVDRSFVADLATDAEDRVITRAIIAMGKTLSLTVVAEGVETPEQVAFLRASACDEVQGFYFGRPLPAAQLTARLRD